MAVSHSSNPHRFRNVFFTGVGTGLVVALVISWILPNGGASGKDIKKINDRLGAMEQKLTPASPQPHVSVSGAQAATGDVTVAAINKDPNAYVEKTVSTSGKVSNPQEGVGFFLTDADGTFIWVHYGGKLPSGNATVKGKVTPLKDQIALWKQEKGWPENDSTLTAKLRDEKVFIEADSVS